MGTYGGWSQKPQLGAGNWCLVLHLQIDINYYRTMTLLLEHLATFLLSTKLLDALLIPSHGQDDPLCDSATGQVSETRDDQKDYTKDDAKKPGVSWLKGNVAPPTHNRVDRYVYLNGCVVGLLDQLTAMVSQLLWLDF